MNCTTCKNPIMNPAPTCEWCGSILLDGQNSILSSFSPRSSYKVLFRGTVYIGNFKGKIIEGDSINFNYNGNVINGIVKEIEIDRKLFNSFEGESEIGILI